MTYDPWDCQRRQQPQKQDYDDDNYNYNWMDVVNNSPAKFQPIKKEIPSTEELLKSGLCSKNTCKEEAKDEETGEKTNEKKTARKYNTLCISFCGYQSISDFAKANNIPVPKARDRRAALIARGMKAEDITADDIINFVSMRGKYRRPKRAASCQQNVDNSKLDTSAIKQAIQQEGGFKGVEDKTEDKLDGTTQFENKEQAEQPATSERLENSIEKRIFELEEQVKQLNATVYNPMMIEMQTNLADPKYSEKMKERFLKGQYFPDDVDDENAKIKEVIKQLLKEILVELKLND